MSVFDYLKIALSQKAFIIALIISTAIYGLGITLNYISIGKKKTGTFSACLYDVLILGIVSAIMFIFSKSTLMDIFSSLPVIGTVPNPADIIQVIIDFNILDLFCIGGRIWLTGLMIEAFVETKIDMIKPKNMISYIFRQVNVLIFVTLINVNFNYCLNSLNKVSVKIFFASIFVAAMIATIIFFILYLFTKHNFRTVEKVLFTAGQMTLWTMVLGVIWGLFYKSMSEYTIDASKCKTAAKVVYGLLIFLFMALLYHLWRLLRFQRKAELVNE